MSEGNADITMPLFLQRDLFLPQILKSWPREFCEALIRFVRDQRAEKTARAYWSALKAFFLVVGVPPAAVNEDHVSFFYGTLAKNARSPWTIDSYGTSCRLFFETLCTPRSVRDPRRLLAVNPFDFVKPPVLGGKEKRGPLAAEAFRLIIATCDRSTVRGLRDFAILRLGLHTGRRRRELASLRHRDFFEDDGKRWAKFATKGGKHIVVEVPPQAWQSLGEYWKASGRTMTPESPAFVATMKGGEHLRRLRGLPQPDKEMPLSGSAIADIIKARARRAGLDDKEVQLHRLRHLAAKREYEYTEDVRKVQEFLAHADLKTTAGYLEDMKRIERPAPEEAEKGLGF